MHIFTVWYSLDTTVGQFYWSLNWVKVILSQDLRGLLISDSRCQISVTTRGGQKQCIHHIWNTNCRQTDAVAHTFTWDTYLVERVQMFYRSMSECSTPAEGGGLFSGVLGGFSTSPLLASLGQLSELNPVNHGWFPKDMWLLFCDSQTWDFIFTSLSQNVTVCI